MKLIPLRRIDLTIGKPLPWAIYDKNQNLLMRVGEVVETHQQFEGLIKRGLFRLPKSAAAPAQGVAMAMPNATGENNAGNDSSYDFDEMKLPVGSRLQLQLSTDQDTERHNAKYLGHIKGVSLLVTTPVVDGKVLFIREGQTFIVRTFTGKTAFGFSASVIRACNTPTPYLHLSYPKQLHGVEIRSTKRLAVNIIASAQLLDGTETASVSCLIVNVSPSGALITAAKTLGKVGESILVTFRVKLGPIDGYIETKGIIRSITHVEGSGDDAQKLNHGVQFKELQQPDILLLHSLAYQKMVDGSAEG
jgi:hypothetical protein